MIVARQVLLTVNILTLLFILSPMLITIPASFSDAEFIVAIPESFSLRWYRNFFANRELVDSLLLSLRLAAVATAGSLLLGLPAALALVRYTFPGHNAVKAALMSPLIIPGLILGLSFLIYSSYFGFRGTFLSLAIAHVLVCLPYATRTLVAGLDGQDIAVTNAALSLGATPAVAFWTVTLPMLKASVVASAIFAFVISLDELVVTMFLTAPRLSTLPVEMYTYIEYTSDPTIAAISVMLIIFTSVVVLVLERFVGFESLT